LVSSAQLGRYLLKEGVDLVLVVTFPELGDPETNAGDVLGPQRLRLSRPPEKRLFRIEGVVEV
jgi:hypothetical protein